MSGQGQTVMPKGGVLPEALLSASTNRISRLHPPSLEQCWHLVIMLSIWRGESTCVAFVLYHTAPQGQGHIMP